MLSFPKMPCFSSLAFGLPPNSELIRGKLLKSPKHIGGVSDNSSDVFRGVRLKYFDL
jgi:hypothetical protein